MSKVLKNQTGSAILINDTGVNLPASPTTYLIDPQKYALWAASSDIITYIGNGDVVVNDGSADLSKAEGTAHLQGNHPQSLQIMDDLGNLVESVVDGGGVRRLALDMVYSSPNDYLSKVSSNDTTGDYLKNKIIGADESNSSNAIEIKEVGDGGNESLKVAFDESKITITESQISDLGHSTDHGALGGLGDDDHSQYHNDARGDARYYTETELDAGQLDNRYFTETEHLNSSAGAGDAGKPVKLDAAGHIDASMINDADVDHDQLTNYVVNEHIDWTSDQGATNIHSGNYTDTVYSHPNHTGEVTSTGDGAQVVDKTAISNKTNVTAAATDEILIGDASDTGNLKKVTAQSIADLAAGGADTFADIQVDGVSQSTGAPTLDFDSSDFLLTETPTDDFDITIKDSGIDHDALTNTHNLTTDIDHDSILNNHNLTTDINHNTILNNHNLTTDIDHNQTTNYVANEHIDWTSDQGATNIHAGNYTDTNTTDHTAFSNIGVNSHATIDTHLGSTSNPHSVTINQVTPTTTKGDIIVENATVADRLAVGTDGQVLTADSAEATGLKWAAAGGGGSSLTVEDEGTPLTTAATKMNFVGDNVTVTEPVTDEMLVTITDPDRIISPDTNNYIIADDAEHLRFYTANNEQMRIDGPTLLFGSTTAVGANRKWVGDFALADLYYRYGTSDAGINQRFYAAKGSEATPTTLGDGYKVYERAVYGHEGTSFLNVFTEQVTNDSTISTGSFPVKYDMNLHDGTSPVNRFRIRADGTISTGATVDYEDLVTSDDDIPNRKFVVDRDMPTGGSTGQVLEKVNGTDFNTQWATPSGGLPPHSYTYSETSDTTTSTSYSTVATTEFLNLPAGTYAIIFSGTANVKEKNQLGYAALFKNTTEISGTERAWGEDNGNHNHRTHSSVSIVTVVAVNGTDDIYVKFKSGNSGDEVELLERTITAIKVEA